MQHVDRVMGALEVNDKVLSWSTDKTLHFWDPYLDPTSAQSGKDTPKSFAEIAASYNNGNLSKKTDNRTVHVLTGHTRAVTGALAFTGDGTKKVISWSKDNTLRVWNLISGKVEHVFEGHTNEVTGALVHGTKLLSWSKDKTLRVWNPDSGEQ